MADTPTVRSGDPLLLPIKEAAARVGVTPWTMYRLCDDGRVSSVYQGRRRYVRMESLRAYVDSLPTVAEDAS